VAARDFHESERKWNRNCRFEAAFFLTFLESDQRRILSHMQMRYLLSPFHAPKKRPRAKTSLSHHQKWIHHQHHHHRNKLVENWHGNNDTHILFSTRKFLLRNVATKLIVFRGNEFLASLRNALTEFSNRQLIF